MNPRRSDEAGFMHRALQLAARGRGLVEPNPMVGCVLVLREKVIGEGYHRRFGGPHAEVEALGRCHSSPRGATAFVTLEPCCFVGKTPACTQALIEANVGRVVAALRDPNPRVTDRGFKRLRSAGIKVDVGLLAEQATQLNAPYFKLTRRKRPWVILKWAQSLDGKIATSTGDAKWISDDRARAHAHRVRARLDAIIVGRRTVETDDPQLTARVARVRRVATRLVLDTMLQTSAGAKLVRTAREVPTWIICGPAAPRRRAAALQAAGCVIHRLPADRNGIALPALLDLLGAQQMTNVLVEGGGKLLGRFVDQRLADEFHIYVAPTLIGGERAVSALSGQGPATIRQALRLSDSAIMRRLGDGWFVRAICNPLAAKGDRHLAGRRVRRPET